MRPKGAEEAVAKKWRALNSDPTLVRAMTLTEETSSPESRSAHVQAFVRDLFKRSGWHVQSDDPAIILVDRHGKRFALEVKLVREARRNELKAHLADAYLRALAVSHRMHAAPLPVIGAPAISDSMAKELLDYAKEYLGGSAWGLLDGEGRLDFHGVEELPQTQARPESGPSKLTRSPTQEHIDPFTDLGQWILKVLLAPKLPEHLLAGPRDPIRKTDELAKVAGVSVPHAKRLVRYLQTHGFLRKDRRFELMRVDDLLKLWAANARLPTRNDFPARWLLPTGDSATQLQTALKRHAAGNLRPSSSEPSKAYSDDRWAAGKGACLGLFAAAERLGFGLVSGTAPHLYLESAKPELLRSLGLVLSEQGEPAHVWIRVPRNPKACFRGALMVNGIPTADILQCWLDVQSHPTRGEDQANLIFSRVIKPHLLTD